MNTFKDTAIKVFKDAKVVSDMAGLNQDLISGEIDLYLTGGLGTAYIDYSDTQVAAVVEISIDRSTGKIKLHNVWCAIDCGVAVQPDNVIAQTESSIVYGIGLALTERISIKDGAVEQATSTTTLYRATATCRRCMWR
jgi:CO/xanthine dehydrogenase Mo-binding subunit